jgi:hypothetical protein
MSRFVPPAKWRKLAKNVWKTDLGADLPEILVILMSDEEYKKFRSSEKAAMKFLNDHRYLKKPTVGVVFTKEAPKRGEAGGAWIAIIEHSRDSMVSVVASQQPSS